MRSDARSPPGAEFRFRSPRHVERPILTRLDARKSHYIFETSKSRSSAKVFGVKLNGRSRITNGGSLLPSVDGRSIWARRLRDLIVLHENDYGGADAISEAERSLVRRAAALTVELELMEVKFAANGGAKAWELDSYQRAANSLRRLLEGLGLQRRPRDVTGLGEILAAEHHHHG